jgi:L-asparagine transporter-like permease
MDEDYGWIPSIGRWCLMFAFVAIVKLFNNTYVPICIYPFIEYLPTYIPISYLISYLIVNNYLKAIRIGI